MTSCSELHRISQVQKNEERLAFIACLLNAIFFQNYVTLFAFNSGLLTEQCVQEILHLYCGGMSDISYKQCVDH